MSEEVRKEIKIQIQVDDEVAQGIYTNLSMVNHTENEFTFDFLYLQPQQPKAKLRARVISSAKHAKRFLLALEENIKKYEEKFGPIDVSIPTLPPQKPGSIH